MWKWKLPRATQNAARIPGIFAIVVMLWSALPAAAQCNPSFDPDCYGSGNGLGPDVGISPDGGAYVVDSGTKAVPITIVFSDADGLNPASVQVRLTNGSATVPVSGLTWKANPSGTGATLSGALTLSTPGDNVLSAQIADREGTTGAGRALFKLSVASSANPVISWDAYHPDYRNTSLGSAGLVYSMPAYTSENVERTLSLYYNSEQALPTAFVSVDARPAAQVASQTVAVSLYRTTPGPSWTLAGREYFFKKGTSNMQRLAAEWSMKDSPTGAYQFPLFVRIWSPYGWNQSGGYMRVLIVNERNSRYGAGWSLAIPRLYSVNDPILRQDGILMTEGNGVARFFLQTGCTNAGCTYKTPDGDFTSLFYSYSTWTITRTATDGSVATFDTRGLLLSFADPVGRTTTYTWQNSPDAAPVPVLQKVTDPAGKVTLLEYYPSGYLRQITDPAGRAAVFRYSGYFLTSITGPKNLGATYDTYGRVTSYTIDGGTWDVAYDKRGEGWDAISARPTVASITGPSIIVSGAATRPVTRYTSLQAGTVLGDTEGHTLGTYNGTTFTGAAEARASDDTFIRVIDPEGHTTQMSSDRYGNPVKVVDGGGRVATATWNEDGLPLSSVDVTDNTTIYSWNARGQLLQKSVNGAAVYLASYKGGVLPEFEMSAGEDTWFTYGARGEILRSWTGTKTDSQRTATTYEYDSSYRLTLRIGPNGERTEWSYGGNVWGNVDSIRTTGPDGSVATTSMTYDGAGRVQIMTNPLGHATTSAYDDLNRLIRYTDALQRATVFLYTGPDLTRVTDGAGKSYTYSYDALGNLLRETYPDGKFRTYTYNKDGLLTSSTDRRLATVAMSWDTAHRVLDRTADGAITSFRYPDPLTTVVTNSEGTETVRLVAGVGGLGSVTSAYAALSGRTYEVTNVLDPDDGWRKKGIDIAQYSNGSRLRIDSIRLTPNHHPVDATYRSELVVQDLSGGTSTLYFDLAGQHVRTTFPNGVSQNHAYTADGRLDSTSFTNAVVNQTFGATFQYDLIGRLTSRTSIDTLRQYDYDPVGQLARYERSTRGTPPNCNPSYEVCEPTWLPAFTATYMYDATGNRTDSSARVDVGNDRYTNFDGYVFSYDAEGNITQKKKAGVIDQTYEWNALGQLTRVTTNGSVVTYGYNGRGTRVRRTEAAQSRYFLYSGYDLLMELDSAGNAFRSYTFVPGTDRPLGLRVTSGTTETAYYYVTEQPGHVSGLINLRGDLSAVYRYSPWGAAESTTGGASSQPLRFMGRELDSTGLYYVRNRWYDPAVGRFTSEDPIGFAGGMNRYAYVENDPVNRRDPSGLCPEVTLTRAEYYELLGYIDDISNGDPEFIIMAMKCDVTIDFATDINALDRDQQRARERMLNRVKQEYGRLYSRWLENNPYGTWVSEFGHEPRGPVGRLASCMRDADNDTAVRTTWLGRNPAANTLNLVLAVVENAACVPTGIFGLYRAGHRANQ
jgi:RHS repeat-associated protein